MKLFKQASNESKKFNQLVAHICMEFGIDNLVVLHFINSELERIDKHNRVDNLLLIQLEKEIIKQLLTEVEIKQRIKSNEKKISDIAITIETLSLSIKTKTDLMEAEQTKLSELQTKLNELDAKLREIEKNKKKAHYDIMMKSHSIKTKTDSSFKKINLILTLLTIMAIIIAILIIINKNK